MSTGGEALAAEAGVLAAEDEARASVYGLIARLYYAAPDEALLGQIRHAKAFEGSEAPIAHAWRELAEACRNAYPVVLENEHTELLVGTGKTPVTPYLTHYTIKFANENPLVDLRQQLGDWGIGRRQSANEPEDHISGVCEAMRFAIAVQQRSAEEQKMFFEAWIYPGAIPFCDAVSASSKAVFYKRVAAFTRSFLDVERTAFDIGKDCALRAAIK